jgi:hypothetical protein
VTFIGPKPNLLGVDETKPAMRLEASQPVLMLDEIREIRQEIKQLKQLLINEKQNG